MSAREGAYVFVSYAAEDRPWVQRLAGQLGEHGLSVWWDRTLPLGEQFDLFIREKLNGSSCVLVVWSRLAVESQWVRAEADLARRRNLLIPVRMDSTEVPLVYQTLEHLDLQDWDGSQDSPEIQRLVQDIRLKLEKGQTVVEETLSVAVPRVPEPFRPLRPVRAWPIPRIALAGACVLGALIAAYRFGQGSRVDATPDTSPPYVIVVEPRPNADVEEGALWVRGTVDEEGSLVQVDDEQAEVEGQLWSHLLRVSVGSKEIRIRARDSGGNWSATLLVPLRVHPGPAPGPVPDATPPALTVVEPAEGAVLHEGEVAVSGRTEVGSGITVEVNGRQATVVDGTWSCKVDLHPGDSIRVRALDQAGNVEEAMRPVDVRPASLVALLPRDTSVALRIASPFRLVEAIRKSPLRPTFEPAWEEVQLAASRLGFPVESLLRALDGECILALGKSSGVGGRDLQRLPLLVLGDAGPGVASLESAVRGLRDSGSLVNVREERRFGGEGHLYTLVSTQSPTVIAFAVIGSRYFLSPDRDLLDSVVDRLEALGEAPGSAVAEAMRRHASVQDQLFLHLNLLQAKDAVACLLDDTDRLQLLQAWDSPAHILCGSSLRSLAVGAGIDHAGLRLAITLPVEGRADGLLAPLRAPALSVEGIIGLPQAPAFLACLSADLPGLARTVLAFVDAVSFEVGEESGSRDLEQSLGLPPAILIESLAERVGFFSIKGPDGPWPLHGGVVGLRSNPSWMRMFGQWETQEGFERTTSAGYTEFSRRGEAYCLFPDKLVFGDRFVAERVAAQVDQPPLPLPREVREQLKDDVQGLLYMSPAAWQLYAERLQWDMGVRLDLPGPLLGRTSWRDEVGYVVKLEFPFE